jgi:hypothetical protein
VCQAPRSDNCIVNWSCERPLHSRQCQK